LYLFTQSVKLFTWHLAIPPGKAGIENLNGEIKMAHGIDTSNNRANMAYRGATPWHKLGSIILEGDDAATIACKAGLNFEIIKGEMILRDANGNERAVPELNRSILYRSDTGAPLSVMSTNLFKIVQPAEIMDFIASSVEAMGWKIETAGSLHGGRK
jgi:hypothetical protein